MEERELLKQKEGEYRNRFGLDEGYFVHSQSISEKKIKFTFGLEDVKISIEEKRETE